MQHSLFQSAGLAALFFLALGMRPATAQQMPATGVVTVCGPASLRLRVANPDSLLGCVSVVRVATGQVLFTSTYRTAYGHRFDFAGVPAGTYLMRLRLGRTHTRYRVQMGKQAQLTFVPAGEPLARNR